MDLTTLKAIAAARKYARDGTTPKAVRIEAGLTLAQVARTVGVSQSTLSRWESGQRTPRPDALLRWLEALDVLDEVIGRDTTLIPAA